MSEYVFKLFIAGHTSRSQNAVAALRKLCKEHLSGTTYELTIVDVLEQPYLAEEAKILATPTVIKIAPLPMRRIVGDLRQINEVLLGLDLDKLKKETSK